ncbi:MAG: hypothetical protein LBG83_04745 [Oscillospiraceae bacterium]|nr:hypothetical protein [Oscillospiraceae bacterium]
MEPDKKSGRDAKVPYCPATGKRASASNPATWGTLAEAMTCADKYNYSGVGFVFTRESGIVGVDIDHCLDTQGQPNEIAADILSHLPPTYIEISPSGTGLHIFLRGVLPLGGNRNAKNGVEMYNNARYFTMTGRCFQDSIDKIEKDNGAIKLIHEKYIKTLKNGQSQSRANQVTGLSDDEIIARAQKSKDAAEFMALWRGEFEDGKHSETDYALCRKLAFWTGRDDTQIDRLFRKSQLYREKWDVKHNAQGETYGQITIRNACAKTEKTYAPAVASAPESPEEIFKGP